MNILNTIKKLREKLTGTPGRGNNITEAINDLTEGLTGKVGTGYNIASAIDFLADNADDISGGGEKKEDPVTILFDGVLTTEDDGYGNYGTASLDVLLPRNDIEPPYGCPDYITIEWDGVEYKDLPYNQNSYGYGAEYSQSISGYDFSEYPFYLSIGSYGGYLNDYVSAYTESDGDHLVTITAKIGELVAKEVYDNDITTSDQGGQYVASPLYLDLTLDGYPISMNVEFDGVEYSDLKLNDYAYYGAPYDGEAFDFTDIPFAISVYDSGSGYIDCMTVYTAEAGTFSMTANAFSYVKGEADISITNLSVTENGDYYSDPGVAYNHVNVNVPTLPDTFAITFVNGLKDMRVSLTGFNESLNQVTYDNVRPSDPPKTFYYPNLHDESVVLSMYTNSISGTFPDGFIGTVSGADYGYANLYYSSDKKHIFVGLGGVDSSCTITVSEGS